jgi:hypothetical protein
MPFPAPALGVKEDRVSLLDKALAARVDRAEREHAAQRRAECIKLVLDLLFVVEQKFVPDNSGEKKNEGVRTRGVWLVYTTKRTVLDLVPTGCRLSTARCPAAQQGQHIGASSE